MGYYEFLHGRVSGSERRLINKDGKRRSQMLLPYPEPPGPWEHPSRFNARIDPYAHPWWVLACWRMQFYKDRRPPKVLGLPGQAAADYVRLKGAPKASKRTLLEFELALRIVVDDMLGPASQGELESRARTRLGLQAYELSAMVCDVLNTSRFQDDIHARNFLERRALAISTTAMRSGGLREGINAAKFIASLRGLTSATHQTLILNQQRAQEENEAFEIDVTPLERPRLRGVEASSEITGALQAAIRTPEEEKVHADIAKNLTNAASS